MSMEIKITYHPTKNEKWSFYSNGAVLFSQLKKKIEYRLFTERKETPCELRLFWIDSENDNIEISTDGDYDSFMSMNHSKFHIHVAPITASNDAEAAATDQQNNTSQTNGVQQKFLHKRVSCDSCSIQPIVGFRYKCLQCPDYDLCERCESQHFHAEHLMIRIPSDDPILFESFAINNNRSDGRRHNGHRHKRASKSSCPFVAFGPDGAYGSTAANSEYAGGRRGQRGDIFKYVSNVMQNLMGKDAGNAEATSATEVTSSQSTQSQSTSEKQSESFPAEGTACGNTVPAPSPTPDSSIDSEQKKKVSRKCPFTPDEVVDILPSLDPQYIKAGIKILSNMNEMFAKIFDPEDGVYAATSPAKVPGSVKKNENLATAPPAPTNEEAKPLVEEQSIEVLATAEDQAQAEASISKLVSISSVCSDGRSSQTEETDWQMLEKPQASLNASIPSAGARPIEEVNRVASANATDTNSVGAVPDITKNTITVTPTPPPPNHQPVEVASAAEPRTESAPQQIDHTMINHHPVAHINNSIVTMMAMGFSNEGGWLTRLLESVNGNIPEAVDLLHSTRK